MEDVGMRRFRVLILLVVGALVASVAPTAAASVIHVSNAAELVAAINAANAAPDVDVIELTADITVSSVDNNAPIGFQFTGPNGLPVIVEPLVILGNGHAIARDESAPMFRLFAVLGGFYGDGNLVLDNVVLRDGDVSEAAPLPGCGWFTCLENTGGAVLNYFGVVEARNGTAFFGNAADAGGAIGNLLGVTNLDDVTFGSTADGNRANYGGALHNLGTDAAVSIRAGLFAGNQATTSGGAIHNRGQLTVSDSLLVDNHVTGYDGNPFGQSGGGAVNNNSFQGVAVFVNTRFEANSSWQAGAIGNFNASDVTLVNSDVVNNEATIFGGGGIRSDGSGARLVLDSTRVEGNSALNSILGHGGGIQSGNATLILNGATVSGNQASDDGGGIYADYAAATITNSRIENNTAAGFGDGGGIYWNGPSSPLSIVASVIADNTASGFNSEGGGIFIDNPTSFAASHTIHASTIRGNVAGFGAGISSDAFTTTIAISDTTISENVVITSGAVGEGGGGIANEHGVIEVTNSTISGNRVENDDGDLSGSGGAVHNNNGGTVHLTNTTVTNNSARRTGGLRNTYLVEVADSIIAGNVATVVDSFSGPNCTSGSISDLGGNFTDDGTNCPAGFTVSASIDLGTLADNGGPTETHALLPTSVAIDAGVSCSLLTDQRGVVRDNPCDAGSYEGDVVFPTVSFETASSSIDEDPGGPHSVTVRLDNTDGTIAAGAVDVHVVITGTAAGAGNDYAVTTSLPLSFAGASWPAPGTIIAHNIELDVAFDQLVEGAETIELALADSGIQGPADLGSIADHTVTIGDAPVNRPPIADADGPYLTALNEPVALDGTASFDPDGDPLSYHWSAEEGSFDDPSLPQPEYTSSVIGIHVVQLEVCDNSGVMACDAVETTVVVYDSSAGFVTGGGWIDSPAGAYTADPSLTGKATFGFVSKYKKGANTPTGNTEFQFKAGGLNFHSSSYEWLVVTGGNDAKFKGVGTINGEGPYKFQIWAGDGDTDTFRIKIWTEDALGTETVIYDNGFDQAISGGSIVIHTKNK
jgi:predicted outer membrane repeat protein